MYRLKVCLIEDDPAYLFLVKTLIRSAGGEVETIEFHNGRKAIDFMSQHITTQPEALPQVIFLDLNMPVMDGWQFLTEFEKMQPLLQKSIPVYILSSSISERDLNRARGNKLVAGFIEKPMEENRFLSIVESLHVTTN